jgi:2',3'-cyclic-nucleotide 2'-phosphodiesterase/3'-nucleotidase
MKLRALAPWLLVLACGAPAKEAPKPPPPTSTESKTSSTAASVQPETPAPPSDPTTAHIQVFGLSDFHGWLLPLESPNYPKYHGGIANIGGQLVHKEKMHPKTSVIVDNGDMWTGQTESTFLRGEPVIQAYNALGVAAANIANHEFDFGVEILKARETEAKFPFLGANIVKAGTRDAPDFAKAYTIVERDGIKVGIIGLSYIDTPKTTLAKHVTGLEFKGYAETLKRVLPEVKAQGATVIIVLFHDGVEEVEKVLKSMPDSGINAVLAGQTHHRAEATVGSIDVASPWAFGRSYVRFDVDVDRASKKVTGVKHEIVDVTGDVGAPAYPPSAELTAIVESARQKTKSLSNQLLGRLAKPLPQGSFGDSPIGQWVVDSWLAALPDAEVAICNHGAFRKPLGSGAVTMGDVISVQPFENNLYVVHITGKQLKEELAIDGPVVSGISWTFRDQKDGKRAVVSAIDRKGQPIDEHKKYAVAINDFMYFGGDGFTFKEMDPAPEDTGLSWRQPVIRALTMAEQLSRKVEPVLGARAKQVR